MIMTIYKRALGVLMQKPLKLWGISLLYAVLSPVLLGLCGFAIPGLGLAVGLLLSTSMLMVYLHGYRGEDVQVLQLFDCFKDWQTIKRVVLGLAWMMLWIFLWGLIPIVGFIFAIIRAYEYRLTPYILITEPDVPITDAIKLSKERTNGYKLKMFGAEALAILGVYVVIFVVGFIAGMLSMIPLLGALILVAYMLAVCVVAALLPLFLGLVQAAFYEEISNPTMDVNAPELPAMSFGRHAEARQNEWNAGEPVEFRQDGVRRFCKQCGRPLSEGMMFCTNCGTKVFSEDLFE